MRNLNVNLNHAKNVCIYYICTSIFVCTTVGVAMNSVLYSNSKALFARTEVISSKRVYNSTLVPKRISY